MGAKLILATSIYVRRVVLKNLEIEFRNCVSRTKIQPADLLFSLLQVSI